MHVEVLKILLQPSTCYIWLAPVRVAQNGAARAGVLKWKAEAERLVRESGLPFTILRPSRLTDGPYTSFDLNTLLQGTAGTRRSVQLSPRDDLLGEASRIAVAGAPRASMRCFLGYCRLACCGCDTCAARACATRFVQVLPGPQGAGLCLRLTRRMQDLGAHQQVTCCVPALLCVHCSLAWVATP